MSDASTQLRDAFNAAGQGHVFAFWDRLGPEARAQLLAQAAEIDLAEVAHLHRTLVAGGKVQAQNFDTLMPAPYLPHPQNGGDAPRWEKARQLGEQKLREGKVACFTVAGGQGTRLGYDGPKGTFPVTPIRHKVLFHVFAEKILAAGRRAGAVIPWFIMTSHANHAQTVAAFEAAGHYGLDPKQVHFFTQGRMPAVGLDGKILLEAPDAIAMSPDGHGGSLRALVRSGAVATMRAAGIEALSYFQVDNPLVQSIDPTFIGFHFESGSEMSSKMIPKAYPGEKVGHFCLDGEKMVVIEYSDLPMARQEEKSPDGRLRFLAGSIAIHILAVDFVERAGRGDADYALPFHRADKKIKTIDAAGNAIEPKSPNGVKFEMFVFDALPFARNPIVIETLREDDFSPVKNAEGIDSPKTCAEDQIRQWTRWLRAAGVTIETDATGLPPFAFEVSPLFADSEAAFLAAWKALTPKPKIEAGLVLG